MPDAQMVKIDNKLYFFEYSWTDKHRKWGLSINLTASSAYDHDDDVQKTFDLSEDGL